MACKKKKWFARASRKRSGSSRWGNVCMQYAIWRVADKKTVGCLAGRQKLGTHSTLFHAHELWMKVNQATSTAESCVQSLRMMFAILLLNIAICLLLSLNWLCICEKLRAFELEHWPEAAAFYSELNWWTEVGRNLSPKQIGYPTLFAQCWWHCIVLTHITHRLSHCILLHHSCSR